MKKPVIENTIMNRPIPVQHSELQVKCRELAFKYATKLADKQAANGQYKTKKPADLHTQTFITLGMLEFIMHRGGVHYAFAMYEKEEIMKILLSAQKSVQYICSLVIKAPKGSKIKINYHIQDKYNIDATACALLAIGAFCRMQVNEHYQPISPFKLDQDDNKKYLVIGEKLARYLYSQRSKETKTWAKSVNHGLILDALFTWVQTCRTIWSHYSSFKTDEYYSYLHRDKLFKTLLVYAKKDDPELISALSVALIYSPDAEKYKDKLFPYLKKISMLKDLSIYNMVRAANYFCFIWADDSVVRMDSLLTRVEAKLGKTYDSKPKSIIDYATLPILTGWARFSSYAVIMFHRKLMVEDAAKAKVANKSKSKKIVSKDKPKRKKS